MIIRSLFSLRKKAHLATRLTLGGERLYWSRYKVFASVYISFGVLDFVLLNPKYPLFLILARSLAPILSGLSFALSRGRSRYATRMAVAGIPYCWTLEIILITFGFSNSCYLAGLFMIILIFTTVFSARWNFAAVLNTIFMLPILVASWVDPRMNLSDAIGVTAIIVGLIVVASIVSHQTFTDLCKRLNAEEVVRRTLGNREREVREKATELSRRQLFERQFSPQVIRSVLDQPNAEQGIGQFMIVTAVIDIEGSTEKADTLEPHAYSQVIQEVIDVFAACCLKWDVTLDKFTGDGYLAFAGAPVACEDGLKRCISACFDTMSMLETRRERIEFNWKGPFNVRFAVVEGPALVGFLGTGAIKNFSAIGKTVSLTYRLLGVANPGEVIASSPNSPTGLNLDFVVNNCEVSGPEIVTGLRGFNEKKFTVRRFSKKSIEQLPELGRCEQCGTPLVFVTENNPYPKVDCPSCAASNRRVA